MVNPLDNSYKYIYQDPNVRVSHNPLAAPQKPFNINAAEKPSKASKDLKRENNKKKKDKNGKDIEDDEEEDKPLPRPMGL